MDPSKIPFNALIVGPTNSGKSKYVVDQIYGPFRGKFDYIVLICPTFAHNKTYHRIGENDPRMIVIISKQHEVEIFLNIVTWLFEGTNTLIILDDCAASKDVKGRTGQLVNLGFSARHIGISGPNIPALREQLAVLVSTGKSKEAIGVQLTHEQLKRLTDKEVEKYYKRYETFVGSKTTESMVDSLLTLLTRGLQMVIEIDDVDAMKKELKEDFIINKEMTDFVGSLSLKYGKFLAPISAALITAKHIDFNSHLQRKDETKLEEISEHTSPTAEQVQTNSE